MKNYFDIYLDEVFFKTIEGKAKDTAESVADEYRYLAYQQINVKSHRTGEEVMIAIARPTS